MSFRVRSWPSSRALLLCPPSNHLCSILLCRLPVLRRARAESALAAGHGRSRGAIGESGSPRVAHLSGLSRRSPDCPFPMHNESMCKHQDRQRTICLSLVRLGQELSACTQQVTNSLAREGAKDYSAFNRRVGCYLACTLLEQTRMGFLQRDPTPVYEDNTACIDWGKTVRGVCRRATQTWARATLT